MRATPVAAAPTRVRLIRLQESTSAADACSVVLALHGAAIVHNLQCVLTTLDPEGPHQLRIALRRTRVALRVFEPVMRRKANEQLVETARALGRIVGEWRDADVMIDEIVAPAARDDTALLAALEAWRQEVRGRVRAKLLAGGAPGLAAAFARDAATRAWVRPNGGRALAGDVIASAQDAFWGKAEPLAARMPDLSHLELHQLRKAVKALRYGAELAASAGMPSEAPRYKRIQDALGYANDTAALEQFRPPVFGFGDAVQALCLRVISERSGAVGDAIATAMAEWSALSRERAGVAN
ncbi:MAG TPA: CHAD domain-containing protein [Vitreimonas sp.]|nr:CHAD domain-containing protein [Vitreimonas sp.]